jgi:hypothetical protein
MLFKNIFSPKKCEKIGAFRLKTLLNYSKNGAKHCFLIEINATCFAENRRKLLKLVIIAFSPESQRANFNGVSSLYIGKINAKRLKHK